MATKARPPHQKVAMATVEWLTGERCRDQRPGDSEAIEQEDRSEHEDR